MNHRTGRVFAMSLLAVCLCSLFSPSLLPQTSETDPAAEYMRQGNAALAAHHYQEAIKAYQKANKTGRDACASTCMLALAKAQAGYGNLDDAVKSLDKALSLANDDRLRVLCHTMKGDILGAIKGDTKKLKLAEAEYRSALQLEPQAAPLHLMLGIDLLKDSQDAESARRTQRLRCRPLPTAPTC